MLGKVRVERVLACMQCNNFILSTFKCNVVNLRAVSLRRINDVNQLSCMPAFPDNSCATLI